MRSVPRPVLRRAAWAALAALVLGPALGACASTVTGHGTIDAALAAPATPSEPTGGSGGATPTGTDQPTGESTESPTAEPSASPSDGPSDGPSGSATVSPAGSSEDRQTVAALAEAFYHGVAAKDGDRVCAMLTASARREAAEGDKDCAAALRAARLTDETVTALRNVRVDPEKVRVTGASAEVPATATTVNGASTTETGDLQLVREGNDWKINDIT
jgi:hypothetical protein